MKKLLSAFVLVAVAKLSIGQKPVDSLPVKKVYPSGITLSGGVLFSKNMGYHVSSSVFAGNKRVQLGFTMGYNNISIDDTLTANKGPKALNSVAVGLTARAYAEGANLYIISSAKYLMPVYDKSFNARGGLGLDFGFGVYGTHTDNGSYRPVFLELGVSHLAFITPTLERPSATILKVSVGTIF